MGRENGGIETFQIMGIIENFLSSKQEGQITGVFLCVFFSLFFFLSFFRSFFLFLIFLGGGGVVYNYFFRPVRNAFLLKLPTIVGEQFLRLLNSVEMQFQRNFSCTLDAEYFG